MHRSNFGSWPPIRVPIFSSARESVTPWAGSPLGRGIQAPHWPSPCPSKHNWYRAFGVGVTQGPPSLLRPPPFPCGRSMADGEAAPPSRRPPRVPRAQAAARGANTERAAWLAEVRERTKTLNRPRPPPAVIHVTKSVYISPICGDRVRLGNSRISHSVSYDSEVRLLTNHAHKYPALGPAYQSILAWPSLWGCFFGTLPMDPMCHCLTIAGIIFSGRDRDQAEIATQVYETLPPPTTRTRVSGRPPRRRRRGSASRDRGGPAPLRPRRRALAVRVLSRDLSVHIGHIVIPFTPPRISPPPGPF